MTTPEATVEALRRALVGEAEPLSRFGVSVIDVPWWRRRVQRYLWPSRYRLYVQLRIIELLIEHLEDE